ncbi:MULTISPECIES: sensor histidine kinase [Calothrix]|uniref:histidine kinase n=2 Tax=Calothrix TaxID=1186 RepID=A0ABR8AH98_9CYAN|nr:MULTISPECIES: PAS domain S-box protein [Calothrix]MBD2199415.1 PAS domain S-box protein [Calothrix parietina FACHB-288]MBD2228216.1 PAS domain S-box protein [Calothrix anomala FACHB-343]
MLFLKQFDVTHITKILSFYGFGIGLTILLLLGIYLLHRQIVQRQRVEILLRQQSDRERLVTQIAQQIRQSLDIDEVLATTVSEVQRFLQADRVLIYRLWNDGTGSAIHETALAPYPRVLGHVFPEEVFPQEYHQAYSLGKTLTIANVEQAEIPPCLVEFVQQFGVKAKLVVPIIQENRENLDSAPYLWGLLIAHQCSQPRQWEAWEVELMTQLATQVAIAIQQSELYNQLQQLNAQLEQRVQQRTAELAIANTSLRAEIAERQRTEIALRHTNDTLQALIKASPRAIVMLDRQGKVKIWNPAAEKMFGWTETEVLNRSNPISLEDYPTLQQNVLQGKTYSQLEFRQQKKDGTPIDIVFSAAPLLDTDEQINGIVAVIADITEQKRQAEQVRLLQSVVLNTNDAILITEADTINEPGPRILYVNEAFTRITGYQPEEVLGKTPRILQGPKTDRQELQKIRASLARWEPVTVEVINYRKDGTEFWNEFSIVPVANHQGWYTHWIAVQRDTTSRKQVEQALRQSEERWRSLIENALDIIMILDPDGTISYVSPSVQKILGYAVGDLLGNNVMALVHPDDIAMIGDRLTNTIPNPELTRPIEFRYRHQDNSWRILEAISQPFVDSVATLRIIVNARDITERKRLDEIRLALEREKELSALKTRFFSMASHEFRTPLSIALAAAQVLENCRDEWETSAKRLRNLQRIQDSVKHMVQLLDDILTINRAETGKLAFNPQALDLELYCRDFLDQMRESVGSQHNLRFSCQGQSALVCMDEKLLRSMLSNLLSNAIKYSPTGGVVHLSLEFQSDRLILAVQDRGIGMSPEDQKQLFEPFHRGKNVRTIPGTGLGLVVVKKCVDLHQGTINITSEVGMGTTCLVTIPLLRS